MPTNTNTEAIRIHTHFGRVSINMPGAECAYLDPNQARALAKELVAFADDIGAGNHRCTRLVMADGHRVNESNGKAKPKYV